MKQPVYFWDPVIAPRRMVSHHSDMFSDWRGDFIISSLKPGGPLRIELEDRRASAEERLSSDRGRVRDVEIDSDGALLALTDYENGRLVRLTPKRGEDS